jgi:hypothetical protein
MQLCSSEKNTSKTVGLSSWKENTVIFVDMCILLESIVLVFDFIFNGGGGAMDPRSSSTPPLPTRILLYPRINLMDKVGDV